MSHINHYYYSHNVDKNKQDNLNKNQSKNSIGTVVRINPANLNNYQQIVKNDQLNKNDIDLNKNPIKFIVGNSNLQINKTKNFPFKIRIEDQNENFFRNNLRQDRSADRVIEPQRQVITADMMAKNRLNLNHSVNLKSTRTPQMNSANNRNALFLNYDNREKDKNRDFSNNMTLVRNNKNQLIMPNNFMLNSINYDNRALFSPMINKNISIANQTKKKNSNNLQNNSQNNKSNANSLEKNLNFHINCQQPNSIIPKTNSVNQLININYNSNINNVHTPSYNNERNLKDINIQKEKREKDCRNNNNPKDYKTNYNFFNDKKNFNIIENNNLQDSKKIDDSNNIYNPSAKSVKEYSYKENKNPSYRNSMEDFPKIIDKYMNDNTKGLFCLYDGHGGSEPVKYVCERVPEIFSKFLNETKNNIEKSLVYTFQKIDDELKLYSDSENVGTTACLIYIYKDADIITGGRKTIYCANIGDTRSVLLNNSSFKRMSYDHKCTDESEVARIRKVGGIVFNGRVFGQLALSRALGDHAMKKYGVICTPYINKHILTEKDKYIVICSDGVWDVLSDGDVFDISTKIKTSEELSSVIVNTAIEKGSRDNISCIAIKIN